VAIATSRRTSDESLMHYDQAGEYRSARFLECPLKLTTPCIVSNARLEADSASHNAMPLFGPSYAGVRCLNRMLQVGWCLPRMYVFRRLVCMSRSGIWSVPVYFGADSETSAHEQSETLVLVHLDEWSADSAPSHSGKLCA
jgi:hypothetical protein